MDDKSVHLILTLVFGLALFTSVYFFSKLFHWLAWKINPSNFNKKPTEKDTLSWDIIMIFSIILWSILFYFKC